MMTPQHQTKQPKRRLDRANLTRWRDPMKTRLHISIPFGEIIPLKGYELSPKGGNPTHLCIKIDRVTVGGFRCA